MPRFSHALTIPIAVAVAGLLGTSAAAVEPPAETVVRLGIVHPLPRLCVGQERTQRDARVLRLAYGVGLTPTQRMAWPWFLRAESSNVIVDMAALWPPAGVPASGSPAAVAPAAVAPAGGGALTRWLERVAAQIPAVRVPPDALALPAGEGHPPAVAIRASDPWLGSRLNGSGVLPYREEFGVTNACRGWPAGIEYLPGRAATEGGRVRYVLRRLPGPQSFGFALSGFGSPQALWADFAAGKIDVALADSESLQQDPPPAQWAVMTGTQQVILRWSPRLESALSPEGKRLLSLAINRPALAGAGGRGAFRAARAFFDPLLPESQPADAGLRWDSRLARQEWLARGTVGPVQRLRLAVLSHPLLEAIARRLAGQWQATLGIAAVPERVDADRLVQAWNAGNYDALLDVVDADDGSLQDVWSAALPGERPRQARSPGDPPAAGDLSAWEQRLERDLPYLPLLTAVQVYAARGDAGPELLRRLCPACALGVEPPSGEN